MLSIRIKQLREKNNLSQLKLGKMLNLSQQAIAKWEMGLSEPDSENIKKLTSIFDVTADYLLGLTDKLVLLSESAKPTILSREDMEALEEGRKLKKLPPNERKIAEKTIELLSESAKPTILSLEDMEALEEGRKLKKLPPNKRKIAEKTIELLLEEDEQAATKNS